VKTVEKDLWKKLMVSPSPPKPSGQMALYSILNDFLSEGEGLKSWKAAKSAEISSLNMNSIDVGELRNILETNFPGRGSVEP
jgi:hypothetical protein